MRIPRFQKIFGVGPLGALLSVVEPALFGEAYRNYASRTGRFLPRWHST